MLQLAHTHLNNGKSVSESGNQLRTFTLLSQFSSSSSIYSIFWSSVRGCIPNMRRLADCQKKTWRYTYSTCAQSLYVHHLMPKNDFTQKVSQFNSEDVSQRLSPLNKLCLCESFSFFVSTCFGLGIDANLIHFVSFLRVIWTIED